jgi:Fic family protein
MRYIWQHENWPYFTWRSEPLLPLIGQARLAQGKLLAMAKVTSLGFDLTQEARADILTEEAFKTSAIEGERLNLQSVRSSVAKHLGLPAAGLPSATRSVDGLVEVLLCGETQTLASCAFSHWTIGVVSNSSRKVAEC